MKLVLLPGIDGTGIMFAPVVEALAPKVDVTVVRYPCEQPLDFAQMTEFARAALPTEGPFVILGESYSGPIAIELAKDASPRLKGIILCCTFARNPRPLLKTLRALIGLVRARSVPLPLLSYFVLGRFATPALEELVKRANAMVAPAVRRTRLRSLAPLDVSATLRSLTLPILCLRATEDRVVPAREARHMQAVNPRIRVVDFEAPHMLMMAQPRAAAATITAFIEGLG